MIFFFFAFVCQYLPTVFALNIFLHSDEQSHYQLFCLCVWIFFRALFALFFRGIFRLGTELNRAGKYTAVAAEDGNRK